MFRYRFNGICFGHRLVGTSFRYLRLFVTKRYQKLYSYHFGGWGLKSVPLVFRGMWPDGMHPPKDIEINWAHVLSY